MYPRFTRALAAGSLAAALGSAAPALALDAGSPFQLTTYNGWLGFEIASVGEGTGGGYVLPGTFDGLGAQLVGGNTLRVQMNHETGDASVSQTLIDVASFQTAINNVMTNGVNNATGGVSFVNAIKQAYDRWSPDGGATWNATVDDTTTSFYRFCSGQSFAPDTYGANRGFVDNVYIAPEEGSTNRLFALDINNADFYQLSGVTGSAPGGLLIARRCRR